MGMQKTFEKIAQSEITVHGEFLCEGSASGQALKLAEPLSFWGGLDSSTGEIIDHSHPNHGENMAGKVLVMQRGRGSSSSSSVLAEAIRAGTGPIAIVLCETDAIIVLGALVAADLYGKHCPIVVAPPALFERIHSGDCLHVASARLE